MRRLLPVMVAALLLAAACGGDDDDGGDGGEAVTTTAPGSTATSGAAGDDGAALPDACELVPAAEAAEATGLSITDGAPTGDERRSVCAFPAGTNGGVGITVGVEVGGRYDEKADVSRNALGVDGEDVPGLGERALFFYSDENFPEGLGGVLVGQGDLTIDITLQGAGDEATTRTAALAVAEVAVGNL